MPRTIDQQFNDDYQRSGLQPSYRTQVKPKYSVKHPGDTGQYSRPAQSSPQTVRLRHHTQTGRVDVTYGPSDRRARRRRPGAKAFRPKSASAKKVFKYSRVSSVNISILSWGMTLWILQLKLALLGIVALGGVGAIDAIQSNAAGQFVISGIDAVFETFTAAASVVLGTEISIGLIDSIEAMLFLSLTLTWLIGLITLFIMGIQYEMFRLHSLYGEGATFKISAVIAALIGYFLPVANLFPWFIFWCFAVWRYPK